MKWYTYYAFKQLFPSGKRLSFFSVMSIVGVTIGVMVLFVVRSIMDGFQDKIKQSIVAIEGDVRVCSSHMIGDGDELNNFIKNFPEVAATAKFAFGTVMIKQYDHAVFPIIKGIDLENECQVVPFKKFTAQGDLSNFSHNSIILSSGLAKQLQTEVGDVVEVYSHVMLESIEDKEIVLPRTLEVIGIYESGYQQADDNLAFVTLETLQDLFHFRSDIHGIAIKLHPKISPEKFAFQLNKSLNPPVYSASWQELNKDFLFALRIEKTMMNFVLIFVLLISAFSITSSLTISVVRKTREIGLINAFGGSVRECASCFIIQGFLIGYTGSVIGLVAGATVLRFRDNIIAAFVRLCGVEDFMKRFYSFAHMPAKYSFYDVLGIACFAIIICCLSGMLPAIKAAKINPAEALRNE